MEDYKEKHYNLKLCEYEILFLYNLLKDSKPCVIDIVDKLQKIINKNSIINWLGSENTDQEEQAVKKYFELKGK